jgi:cytoskeletal protein RodZ
MNEQAKTHNAKAAAARINRKLVRSRTLRRVAFCSFALFALVFTLLSFRLLTGLESSSPGTSVATTSAPMTSSDDDDSEDISEPDDDDDDSYESSSSGSTTSEAPTTRAS